MYINVNMSSLLRNTFTNFPDYSLVNSYVVGLLKISDLTSKMCKYFII